jgi:hypothetical protein
MLRSFHTAFSGVFFSERGHEQWSQIMFIFIKLHCHVFVCVTIDGVWIGELDLLTSCTHNSKPQVITAFSLIYTIYKSPQHPLSLFPARCVFNSRSLATASISGYFSASHDQVLPVQRIPLKWTLSIMNSTIAPSHLSLPCRAWLSCQPSTELTHQPTTSVHFTQLNCIQSQSYFTTGSLPSIGSS